MSIYITKEGKKKKVNITATDVQLLDIDGRFKSKNLEDALKEVGSGTEENMTRIENKVEQLSNPNLFKNGNLNIWSTGTYFVNPNAWYTLDMWKQNTDLSSGTISIEKTDNGMKITISEDAVSNTHYLLSTIQDFAYSLNSDLVASIKFKQSKANMLNFYGKVSNDIIGEYQILTQTLTEIKVNSFFWFDIVKTGEVEIEYIKLEQGNVVTKNNTTTSEMDYVQCYPYNKNISNPNLFINADFRNPVNQRGKTQYTSNEYCVDRWTKWTDTFTTSIQDGFLRNQGAWIALLQYIEGCQKILKQGTVFTISARVRCDKERAVKFSHYDHVNNRTIAPLCPDIIVGTEWQTISFTTTVNVDNVSYKTAFCIETGWNDPTAVLDIEWIKVELGNVATPFIPRHYGEELALCQRYYERSNHIVRGLIGADLLRLSFDVQYKQTKRTAPTLKIYGLNNEEGVVMGKIGTPINFPARIYRNDVDAFGCMDIIDNKGQNFVSGETFELAGWEADAEIY